MAGEGDAGVEAGAGDDVEHPGRVARLQDKLGQLEGRQRGFVGGLEDHRAAGGQRRAELPAGQQQGEVPGDDGADHAHRLATDVAVELGIGHQRQGRVEGGAFDLGGPAGHVAEEVDGQLHVHDLGHGGALAVVQAFQFGQLPGVALHQVGQAPQQVLPLAGAHAAPGRIVEGLAGGLHGAVDVLNGGGGDFAEDFASGRVAEAHGVAAGGVLPFCADQHLQLAVEESVGLGEDGQVDEHGGSLCSLKLYDAFATPMPRL
ncbi:hypothetical protein D9M69_438050 [compost metagenome]